jgi:hypothetical protein
VLVLLIAQIYKVRSSGRPRWRDMHINFMMTGTGIQAILRFCLNSLEGYNSVLLMGGIYEVFH